MTHRLMILNPWGVSWCDDVILELMGPVVGDDVDLACVNLGEGSPPVPYPVPEGRAAAVSVALAAEADGFDAILVACGGDPFVHEMRAAVSVPVLGWAESALTGGRRLGRIGLLRRRLPPDPWDTVWDDALVERTWRRRLARLGFSEDDVVMRRVSVPAHPDLETLRQLDRESPDTLRDRMFAAFEESLLDDGVQQAQAAAAEGVGAVFFTCAFWGPAIAALGEARTRFGVRVIDPAVCAAACVRAALGLPSSDQQVPLLH